jgi:uncharacterized protein
MAGACRELTPLPDGRDEARERRQTNPCGDCPAYLREVKDMRGLYGACALFTCAAIVVAQSPAAKVSAQDNGQSSQEYQKAMVAVDPVKEDDIRALLEITGSAKVGEEMQKAFLEQVRASFAESLPQNERSKRFVDEYIDRFQKKFNPQALTELTIPIYDKHISADDLKGLLAFYRSPLGERTLKALPLVLKESRERGAALEQKAAQETMEELKAAYPEFVPDSSEESKKP